MLTKTYSEYLEYSAPSGGRQLLCVHKTIGFAQMRRLLFVCDKPERSASEVGEALISLGASSRFTRVVWSMDGTVVALSAEFGDDATHRETTLFTRAYDFRIHQQLKEEIHGAPFIAMSQRIAQLLQNRGGGVDSMTPQRYGISFRHQKKWRAIDPEAE